MKNKTTIKDLEERIEKNKPLIHNSWSHAILFVMAIIIYSGIVVEVYNSSLVHQAVEESDQHCDSQIQTLKEQMDLVEVFTCNNCVAGKDFCTQIDEEKGIACYLPDKCKNCHYILVPRQETEEVCVEEPKFSRIVEKTNKECEFSNSLTSNFPKSVICFIVNKTQENEWCNMIWDCYSECTRTERRLKLPAGSPLGE